MQELSVAEVRRMVVAAQLFGEQRPTSLVGVVERLCRLQMDPTAAVARAERLVLWSRLGDYDVAELNHALYDEGSLFEYWAFIVPTADFALHRETMLRYPRGEAARPQYVRGWLAANAAFRRYALAELRRRGPLRSRELEDRAVVPWRTGGWNDGKNVGRPGDPDSHRHVFADKFFERLLPTRRAPVEAEPEPAQPRHSPRSKLALEQSAGHAGRR
jgi:uncharacterized protein